MDSSRHLPPSGVAVHGFADCLRRAARPRRHDPTGAPTPAASLAVAVRPCQALRRMLGRSSAAVTLDVYAGLAGVDVDLGLEPVRETPVREGSQRRPVPE